MNSFQDRMSSFLLNYNKSVDNNAFLFLNRHHQCSIWFKDFELIENIGRFQTFIKCNVCNDKQLIGEIIFGRE